MCTRAPPQTILGLPLRLGCLTPKLYPIIFQIFAWLKEDPQGMLELLIYAMQKHPWFLYGIQGRIQDSPRRGADPPGRGANILICQVFPKNCMQLRKIWSVGGMGSARRGRPLGSASGINLLNSGGSVRILTQE